MNTLLQQFCDLDTPQIIKDTLIGNLLGDGGLSITSRHSALFTFGQSLAHKEYILFLFSIYVGYTTLSELSSRTFVDSRSGNTHYSLSFRLKSSTILGIIHNIFYLGKTKIIRWDCIYTLLTPRALAFWI